MSESNRQVEWADILYAGGPMSPDEESWASWKCGGGPHNIPETTQKVAESAVKASFVEVHPIPDPGGIHKPIRVPRQAMSVFMADLPA